MNKGYLFVLMTAIVSGFSIFLNKFGVDGINPYVFTFSKNVLVVLFLLSALFLFKEFQLIRHLSKFQWLKLSAIGLFGGSVPFLLFFKGLSLSSSVFSALIHKSMFVFVAVLAVLFLRERLSRGFVAAAALLFVGNLLMLKQTSLAFGFPELLILGAVVLWSVETIISKHVLKELPSRVVAFGRMFFGALFILVFLLVSGNFSPLASLSVSQFSWIFFTSALLFVYVITWYAGLKGIPASSAASILVLGSAVTSFLAMAHAGAFNAIDIAGMLLIATGTIIVVGQAYLVYLLSKIRIIIPLKN
jgi:drug/metabolite transporter (DMT)-like permease